MSPPDPGRVVESPRENLAGQTRSERGLFLVAAILSVLLLLVPAWPLLAGRVPIYFDLGMFHLPIRAFYSRCLTQGQSFDWCPHLYGGMFLSGEGEHGPYHPLHLLLYRLLPFDVGFALEAYLHVPVLFAGLFVFLRRYVRDTAALLGALCYTFCSGSVLHNIYPNYQGILAHLPWILWLLDLAATTTSAPRRRLAFAMVALLTGSQLLLGSPQAMSYSLLAEGLFVLFLAWQRRPVVTFWPSWIGANLLGLLMGSVQILATQTLLANSTRGSFDPFSGSLHPVQLAQLLAPNLLSHHLPAYDCSEALYFGAVPLILGLWLLATLRKMPADRRKGLALFAVALGGLSAWLALGKYGYLYTLQTYLPFVGQLRLPARYFTLTALAASLLTAVTFDRLLASPEMGSRTSRRALYLPWAAVAAALLLALFFRFSYPREGGRDIQRNYFAGPVLLGAAALALTAAARGRRLGILALLALCVVDIEVFSLKAPLWPHQSLWGRLPTLGEFQALRQVPPVSRAGRWLDDAYELPSPLLFQQSVLEGYHGGLEPSKQLDYQTVPALRVANIAWHHLSHWIKATSVPGLQAVADYWYAVPHPLPRFRLVSRTQISTAPAADIQNLDIETTALVTHPLDLEASEPGTVQLLAEQPGELSLLVSTPGRQLLVVADSFDPGWRVAIDEQPASVERVNGDFLGCVVERGTHRVRFVFRADCIRKGLLLSLAGLAITVLIAGISSVQLVIQSRRAAGAPDWVPPCG